MNALQIRILELENQLTQLKMDKIAGNADVAWLIKNTEKALKAVKKGRT